jgi:hypothetical protein
LLLARDPVDMSPNEIGALIKIEHVLFRLYNNIDLKQLLTLEEAMDMREAIDGLLLLMDRLVTSFLINSNMTKAAEALKKIVHSCRGCNHRFYLYSKFKKGY